MSCLGSKGEAVGSEGNRYNGVGVFSFYRPVQPDLDSSEASVCLNASNEAV